MNPVDRDLLHRVIEPVVAGHGVDLERLDVAQVGRRHRLTVVVDADGGVDLDRVAELSRELSHVLDDADAMPGAYTLEVSSPGVSRPMTAERHWRRSVGRLVRVRTMEGENVVGRIVSAASEGATLDVDGVQRHVAYAEIRRARVQVEFRRIDADADADADGG